MKCFCQEWASTLLERFRTFNVAEIAVFKVCLITFGILIGIAGRPILKPFRSALSAAFVSSYLYLMFRLIVAPELEEKDKLI